MDQQSQNPQLFPESATSPLSEQMPSNPQQHLSQSPLIQPPNDPYPPSAPPQPSPRGRSSQNLLWLLLPVGVVILVVILLGVTVLSVAVLSRAVSNRAVLNQHANHVTATATSMPLAATYAANVPGPGCDTQGGKWTADRFAQTTCTGGKLPTPNSPAAIVPD